MGRLTLRYSVEKLPLKAPFRIAGYVFERVDCVEATLADPLNAGRGEAAGAYYTGDDADHMRSVLDAHRSLIEDGPSREELRLAMPAGGARNAVDCALWELEAARAGMPVWRLAGIDAPKPVVTTFTIGADSPEKMAQDAIGYAQASSLKLKLTGELDLDIARVHAVRAARPEAWIGVDANQGFTIDNLDPLVDALVEARVSLLEQPLARGREADLTGYKCPIPIAADESCLTLDDVPGLLDRFQVVNIKLDKCGGLTEALLIVEQARRLGLGVMVGNMVGTSLAMAPAFIVGQLCDFVDLDGPLVLASDRDPGVLYSEGRIWCGEDVWGSGSGAAQ